MGLATVQLGLSSPRRKIRTSYTPWEWLWKFGLNPRCHYCETPLTLKTATKDHLTPLCRGGSNFIDNIVPCCFPCNQAKGKYTEEEYWVLLSTELSVGESISNLKTGLEDKINEPGLLKRLIRERERVSWAWHHPARVKSPL